MNPESEPKLTYEEQLKSILVPNANAVVHQDGADFIDLKIHLRYENWILPFVRLFHAREFKIYRLSGLGLEIYRMIRTQPRSVLELVYYLRDTQKLSFFEARNLILQYTGKLIRNGLIAAEQMKKSE